MTNLNQGQVPDPLSIEDAVHRIEALRQEIYGMGNNDREFNIIDDIILKLKDGKVTPEEAVGEVERLKSFKLEP